MPEDTTLEWQATEFARARLICRWKCLTELPQRDPSQVQPDSRPRRRRAPVPQDSRRGHRADEEQRRRAGAPPTPPSPPSPEKRGKVLDVAEVKILTDLVDIRAYVRWEDAGKPEDTPPEWQRAESAMARLDLQIEVLSGASLNDIRRKYNQTPSSATTRVRRLGRLGGASPGQEDARRSRASPSRLRTGRARGSRGVVRARTRGCRRVPGDASPRPARARRRASRRRRRSHRAPRSPRRSWTDGRARPSPNGPSRLINKRMYPVGKDAQLLVQMYESEAADETSAAARRSASKRRVVFTTDAEDDLVLHWGVARDEPGQWLLPKETCGPPTRRRCLRFPSRRLHRGARCLPAAEAAAAGGTVAEEDEECHPLQVLTLELPGEGADELTACSSCFATPKGRFGTRTRPTEFQLSRQLRGARHGHLRRAARHHHPRRSRRRLVDAHASVQSRVVSIGAEVPAPGGGVGGAAAAAAAKIYAGCGTPRSASSRGSATTT